MLEGKKIRVLTALPGIEGHDRGITLINQALRDAGMEVIYLGRFNTPIKIVKAAMEEDIPKLESMGITGFFGQGTPLDIIVEHFLRIAEKRKHSFP